ncbi:hypothetical protein INT45_005418 [Circinella minor]|uniref:Autophagy-related protein 13 n=1 Tax=Circinella minor TaxID=1195481 RepID=A0A8H7RV47_9FUNG|nr:hypothetical protein INT45_005418 [Circinella minor]
MPIPVTKSPSSFEQCSISASDAIIKLIQIILRARLGTTEYKCRQNHHEDNSFCCFHLKHYHFQHIRGSFTITIHIIQQNNFFTTASGNLLERWIISLDPTTISDSNNDMVENNASTTTDETDAILLLQAVYSHTRLMPVHTLLSNNSLRKSDLATMVTMDDGRYRCFSQQEHSCPSSSFSVTAVDTTETLTTVTPDDFPHTAHIKTHQFSPRGRIRLQVVYQDNIADEMSPVVSSGIAMRRLSRLSLSAIEDDTAAHEHKNSYHHQQQHHTYSHHHPFLQQSPPKDSYHNTTTNILHSNYNINNSHSKYSDINYSNNNKKTLSASIPIPNMQYTHHHGLVAYSTSPSPSFGATRAPWAINSLLSSQPPQPPFQQRRTSWTGDQHLGGSLVGSYEESLLSGRMSSMPSKPILFQAQIGVLGKECKSSLRCPPHRSVTFPAFFYDMQEQLVPPYVGTVDLIPPYRLPPKGQLQIVIKNPNKTAVKLFLIPYDVSDMPKNTKTFLRQKSYDGHSLRYAVQVQLCRTEKRRVYLYKHIRVVFANRIADSRDKLKVTCEGPQERGPLTRADLDLLSTL